jgi:hypothetical protein
MWQASATGKIPDKFDLICLGNALILYRSGTASDSRRDANGRLENPGANKDRA